MMRARYEKGGFNPLLAVSGGMGGVGGGVSSGQASFAPFSGNGAAIGGMIAQGIAGIGDTINASNQLSMQKAQLDMEADRLNMLAKNLSLTPPVAGIYGGVSGNTGQSRQMVSGGLSGQRVGNGLSPSGGNGASGTIGTTAHVAPGREVESQPYSSGSMLTEISNKYTDMLGGPLVVPGSDGEPMGIDEVLTVAVTAPWQLAYRAGTKARENIDKYRSRKQQERAEAFYRQPAPLGIPKISKPELNVMSDQRYKNSPIYWLHEKTKNVWPFSALPK
ncbi:hypothetical protein [Aliiroseovarius sp. 2305UL8-7]|uniref:hypothetical protein n=1 Tax=Aliiroseovarius conchicola TaxID=3121637 RepID=UPI003527D347